MKSRTRSLILRQRFAVVGIVGFVLGALLLTSVTGATVGGGSVGGHDYSAVFTNASGLVAGNDVRIAGVRVGKVTSVELDGRRARVEFSLNKDQQVYQGTSATIEFLNLLGQRYINLETKKLESPLPEGSVIPLERTDKGVDLSEVFNAFQPLFATIGPEDVNELASNIVRVLQGQGPTMRRLAEQTATLTRTLADKDQVMDAVIKNLTEVLRTISSNRTRLRKMIKSLGSLTKVVAENKDQVGQTIDSVSTAARELNGFLDGSVPDVLASVNALERWAAAFETVAPKVAEGLVAAQVLLEGYTKSLGLGSYLNTYVCETKLKLGDWDPIDLSLTPKRSERCR